MKRIYDYHTGKLIRESADTFDKRHLNEAKAVSFGDIIEKSRAVYRVARSYNSGTLNLKKLVFSPNPKPIVIWEYKGNFSAKEIMNICDESNIDYCYVSAKTLNGSILDVYANEGLLIVDDLTSGPTGAVEDLIFDIEDLAKQNDVQIVCIGSIDSRNNEIFAEDLASIFANFVLTTPEEDDDVVDTFESVSDKFARYRKLYEGDESEDDSADEAGESEEGGENSGEGEESGEDSGEDEEETEDVPMTAIVLTVKKDDVDKCKEELVDAGIPEDAITDVDTEDDEENGKLKVDADYALELKDYLKGKGIDLEEKIGGEIVDDSAEDSEGEGEGSDEDKDKEDKGDDKSSEEGGEGDEIDFDSEFGDLFGDE